MKPLRAITVTLDAKAIGARIRAARRSRKWSRHDLARVMSVSPNTVTNWEQGWRTPQRDTLVGLSMSLRRTIQWLLLGQRGRAPMINRPAVGA